MPKILTVCYVVSDTFEVSDDTTEDDCLELAKKNAKEIGVPWCTDIDWVLKEPNGNKIRGSWET